MPTESEPKVITTPAAMRTRRRFTGGPGVPVTALLLGTCSTCGHPISARSEREARAALAEHVADGVTHRIREYARVAEQVHG